MRILWFSLIIVFLLSSLCQGQEYVLTERDTLPLHVVTTLSDVEAHWDTVFAEIYHDTTLLATIGLRSDAGGIGIGTWWGSYICSNLPPGGSWVKYYGVYDGDTTPVDASVSILDTLQMQGSANNLTISQIDSVIRAILSGEGLDTLDLYVFDEDTNAVQGVTITVYNFAKTAKIINSKITNVNGKAQVWLNPGQYQVLVAQIGIIQSEWDTVTVVSGGSADTIWVESFDPGTPPSADLCLVYGWVYDINNNPVAGATVQLSINYSPLRFGTVLISPYRKTAKTDATGYWSKAVFPNLALNPSDKKYHIEVTLPDGTILKKDVTVPEGVDSWELTW